MGLGTSYLHVEEEAKKSKQRWQVLTRLVFSSVGLQVDVKSQGWCPFYKSSYSLRPKLLCVIHLKVRFL